MNKPQTQPAGTNIGIAFSPTRTGLRAR
ncbi:MAG: hypothetical protein JWL98_1214, partial [Xanthomonadaceae bacterium]|nr:hypothetical protein [Xanthomonadaceae bacterium]